MQLSDSFFIFKKLFCFDHFFSILFSHIKLIKKFGLIIYFFCIQLSSYDVKKSVIVKLILNFIERNLTLEFFKN